VLPATSLARAAAVQRIAARAERSIAVYAQITGDLPAEVTRLRTKQLS